MSDSGDPAETARRLMHGRGEAALATVLAGAPAGWPYGSLVQVAPDMAGRPLLLLSDLAEHSRNIKAEDRVSLLFDGTAGSAEPLAGPRLSVQGRARRADDPDGRLRARFLRYHPGARVYAGFADFRLYSVAVERAHLVAGFGAIHWLEGREILPQAPAPAALEAAEAGIVERLNAKESAAIAAIARHRLALAPGAWRLAGLDAQGFDLRLGRDGARGRFDAPVADAEAALREFLRIARQAGAAGG